MSWGRFKFAGSSCKISSLFRMKLTGLPRDGSWYISCTAFIIASTNLTSSLSVSLGKFVVICLYRSLSTNTAVSTKTAGSIPRFCLTLFTPSFSITAPIVLFLCAMFSLKSSNFGLETSACRFLLCLVQLFTGSGSSLISCFSIQVLASFVLRLRLTIT